MLVELINDGKQLKLIPETTQEGINLGIFYGENAEHPSFGYGNNCVVFDLRGETKKPPSEDKG